MKIFTNHGKIYRFERKLKELVEIWKLLFQVFVNHFINPDLRVKIDKHRLRIKNMGVKMKDWGKDTH